MTTPCRKHNPWAAFGALALTLVSGVAPAQVSTSVLDYINGEPSRRRYESVLFLGLFNTPDQAEARRLRGVVNPLTGKPFDGVFAFGTDGKVREVTRAIGDNLSWSPLSGYEQLRGIEADYVVAHSNGNDYGANAIKAGYVKVNKLFAAFAPPAGFEREAEHLDVPEVRIWKREGDAVAYTHGKTLLGPVITGLQRLGDVDIGLLLRQTETGAAPYAGIKISRGWPHEPPPISTIEWKNGTMPFPVQGRAYLSRVQYDQIAKEFPGAKATLDQVRKPTRDVLCLEEWYVDLGSLSPKQTAGLGGALARLKPNTTHSWRTYASGVFYDRMMDAVLELDSARESAAGLAAFEIAKRKLRTAAAHAPEAAEQLSAVVGRSLSELTNVANMWTSATPDKPSGKLAVEVDRMTSMARTAQKAIVVGDGQAASRLYQNMVSQLGSDNVQHMPGSVSRHDAQAAALGFGADVIVGVDGGESGQTGEVRRRSSGATGGRGPTGADPATDARGGVYADIRISDSDFAQTPKRGNE